MSKNFQDVKIAYISEIMIRCDQLMNLIRVRMNNAFSYNIDSVDADRLNMVFHGIFNDISKVSKDIDKMQPQTILRAILPYADSMLSSDLKVDSSAVVSDLYHKIEVNLNKLSHDYITNLFDKLFIMEYIATNRIMTDPSILAQLWINLGFYQGGNLSKSGITETLTDAYTGYYDPQRSIPLVLSTIFMVAKQIEAEDDLYDWPTTKAVTLLIIGFMMIHITKG